MWPSRLRKFWQSQLHVHHNSSYQTSIVRATPYVWSCIRNLTSKTFIWFFAYFFSYVFRPPSAIPQKWLAKQTFSIRLLSQTMLFFYYREMKRHGGVYFGVWRLTVSLSSAENFMRKSSWMTSQMLTSYLSSKFLELGFIKK